MPFLDKSGLAHLWNHIIARLNTKVESAEFDEFEESMIERINNIDLSSYETTENAQAKLDAAKSYTDTKTANLASTTVVDDKISTHNTSTSAHNDIRDLISGLTTRLNALANSDDTTLDQLSEIVAYITDNRSLIDGITTSKVNVDDIVDNLTTNVSNKPLSAAQGVVIQSLIDNLQANIDGKADSVHNHDASNITSGTLSSDRLPTVPITKGGTGATTAADALTNLGLTATAKELNYVDGVTSNIQTQLNGKANSSHTHSYLPLSGGTIDGRLSVHGYGNNGGLNLDGYQGRLELRAEIGTASIACVDGTNSAALIFSPNKPANEGVKFSMKKDSTLSLYKLYGEHNKPTANDIGAASTMSVTTAEYNTMSANNELQETTLYMLTDDTEEEDLQATVNEMNNIDYEANLAFDVNEIV